MQNFDLDNFLPYRLAILSQSISGLIAQEYESRFGLTMVQWRVLVIISNHSQISARDICNLTLMDKMTVSRNIKSLRSRKLLISKPSKNDARKSILSLTATGKRIYTEIIPIAQQYETNLLNLLSESQRKTLNETIAALTSGISAISAN